MMCPKCKHSRRFYSTKEKKCIYMIDQDRMCDCHCPQKKEVKRKGEQ